MRRLIHAITMLTLLVPPLLHAQADPATEPSVIAVGKVLPAVVNINTERVVKRTVRDPYDELYYQFFGGQPRAPRQLKQTVQSLGSGFIISADGYIVTNEHVVERAADLKIQVTTGDGVTHEATYITGDRVVDLALIKINPKKPLAFIDLTDLSPNLLGQSVIVLGNPLGYGSSVSRGILSALSRTIQVDRQEFKDLLQTDAAINPGNSGGPLIDLAGRLVGVSSVKMAFTPEGVPTQGIGFAIPASLVRDKVAEFQERSGGRPVHEAVRLVRAYFGLHLQDMTPELREALGYEAAGGVLISDVEPNSPAEAAGLQRGLVIYKLGRYEVSSSQEVETLMEQVKAGTVVDAVVGIVQRAGSQFLLRTERVSLTAR